jgi:RNA polymerase sigma factor (sigma-70 family)
MTVDGRTLDRLYPKSGGERWQLSRDSFRRALDASVAKAFAHRQPSARDVEQYLASLNLADLALAAACIDGHDAAWEHFVREHRTALYRAADAIDPSGGARLLADAIYADLFGLENRDGVRQPLLRFFHGRSSLKTWLRAVLAQRLVDAKRVERRMVPLPGDDEVDRADVSGSPGAPDPERERYVDLVGRALGRAVGRLTSRDRLRLGCYYAQRLTLAETGRLLHEHEATVSRQLAGTRKALRTDVETQLKRDAGLGDAELADCWRSVVEDAGPIDLGEILEVSRSERVGKKSPADRSEERAAP